MTADLHVGGEDGGVVPGHLVPAQVIRQQHDDVRRTLGQHGSWHLTISILNANHNPIQSRTSLPIIAAVANTTLLHNIVTVYVFSVLSYFCLGCLGGEEKLSISMDREVRKAIHHPPSTPNPNLYLLLDIHTQTSLKPQ